MAGRDSHELPEAYLTQRFADRVAPFVFGRHRPSPAPVLILVAGQPAAGKTLTMAHLIRRHRDQDLVAVTGDALRAFHPNMARLLATDALAVPNATAQASGAWVRMTIDHALTHRYSLMLEGTFRDTAAVSATIRRFATAGYRTEVVVLAVRAERSRMDSMLRHHGSVEGQTCRWTPPSAHDTPYERLPATVVAVQALPELDRIAVVVRDGTEVFSNQRGADRRWRQPPDAHDALTKHRDTPLPRDEAQAWLAHYRALFDQLHREHRVDPRALPAYINLHADAARVAAMANPDRTLPDHVRQHAQHLLDQVLLNELRTATDASPAIAPATGPGPGRGFPSLADTQRPACDQQPMQPGMPAIPPQPGNPETARHQR
jgi:UDP-N-acetylglucosamine kinase